MLKIITLSAVILVWPATTMLVKKVNTPVTQQQHFSVIPNPAPLKTAAVRQQAAGTNIADLKQGNWYAEAIKKLQQKEYEFSRQNGAAGYSTPNRKNNLRFYYNEKGFTVEPRTTQLPTGKITAATKPGEIKYTTLPNWKVAFNFEKELTTQGKWEINENKANYITDRLTVQYINDEAGMRQNFIIPSPLAAAGDLKIHFTVATALQQRLQGNRLEFIHEKSGMVLRYDQLKVWDARGKPLEAAIEKSNHDYCIHVQSKNAVYPITIDPLSSSPAAMVESNQANAYLGCSVASAGDVNGDSYSDVIVGARTYDNGEADEGAAFIYQGSASGISTTAAAMVQSNQASAGMGTSVASAGDVNGDGFSDVIAGVPNYGNGQAGEGVAFIYQGSASGINTTAAAMVESNQANAAMGTSVAIAGDVNGDGYNDVIAGAPNYNNGQAGEGVAFVYHGSASGISTTAAAMVESNQANAVMGSSVAGAGDVNGDGYSDVIVGVPNFNYGVAGEGIVYIYHGSASGINTNAAAWLINTQANASLGASVSSAGDVNGDGYSDVIVGANAYDNGESDEGVAFVYHGSASGIYTTAAAMVESNQSTANFGASVACTGDINGDGFSDIIVGAYTYDNSETDEGAAFVYQGSASGISTTAAAIVESNQANAYLGCSVASAGDINGDGFSDIIAGAFTYDNGETDEGAAFIYHGSAMGMNTTATAIGEGNLNGAQLGSSVASAGDVNGDGYGDVILGMPFYSYSLSGGGAAWVCYGSASGISLSWATLLESNKANAYMGNSVAGAGDVNGDGFSDVIIGAPQLDNASGVQLAGAFMVYYGSAGGISTTPATRIEGDQYNGRLGTSVACAGDINGDGYSDVMIGAPNVGVVYIYYGSASGLYTTAASNSKMTSGTSAKFGNSEACAGDVNGDGYDDVIMGAYNYTNGQGSEGAFFVYHGSATGLSTTAATMVERNQANAYLGYSVAGAGDVNGDGYSDVVVGAYGTANAAYVYHGSASGISTTPAVTLLSGKTNANMGYSVSGAGDVNGDGYSDVFVGAPQYSNGQMYEGAVFLYHGSASGINPAAAAVVESNVSVTRLGIVTGAGGDVNGDGYSDVLTGFPLYTGGQTNEGTSYVYYGNSLGTRKRNNLDLYNNDLSAPVSSANFGSTTFGAGLFAKSFLGAGKGKMVWETRISYQAYSGTPITNSVLYTAEQNSYTNLGAGVNLKNLVTKQTGALYTKVRARVKYPLVTALTGQVYGPWRTDSKVFLNLAALPVDLLSFKAQWLQKGKTAQLKFVTTNESQTCCYEIEKSADGVNFAAIGKITATNTPATTSYSFIDDKATGNKQYYRLKIIFDNGHVQYSNLQLLQANTAIEVIVFPNPATDVLQLRLNNSYSTMQAQIINAAGQTVQQLNNLSTAGQQISIPINRLAAGTYFLCLQSGSEKQVLQFVKQ